MTTTISKQRAATIETVAEVARSGAIEAMNELASVKTHSFQRIIAGIGKIQVAVMETVKLKIEELLTNTVGIWKLISAGERIVIQPTKGARQIASGKNTFTAGIDDHFVRLGCDRPERSTTATPVEVYELTKDAGLRKMFGCFGRKLDRFCLTRAQIRAFVEKHNKWLRPGNPGNFFLFKEKGKFYVADVGLYSDGPSVHLHPLDDDNDDTWYADDKHRVIVPRLGI